MDLRLTLAIFVGKIIGYLTKLFGGGATAAPGLYALKIDPNLVKKLTAKIKNGSILISGTNGKTTTSRLAANILQTEFNIIHNRQGSNLVRGIASTLIPNSSIFGNITSDLGLWEVDEATLPEAIHNTSPKMVILLNLFRDQLDRYGEVDSIRTKWQKAISTLPKSTTLALNTDDPQLAFIAKSHKGKIIYFGVNESKINLPEITHVADIKSCLNCGSNLSYSALLSAHLGHYFCPKCDFKRPTPDVSATNLNFHPDFSTSIKLNVNGQLSNVAYQLPGLYNVYNVLAATSIAINLKIKTATIKQSIETFSAAFGRFQEIKLNDKKIIIFLTKNPTGTNEVIRTIASKSKINLLVILNDKIADGRDVSWIWDTNWEILTPKIKKIFVSGTRAWDLATRLKYAGLSLSKNMISENISYSIDSTVKNMDTKDTLLILSTYTALLDVQNSLTKMGSSVPWHKQ